jgi:hypothetical protein
MEEAKNSPIRSLNTPIELDEVQTALEARTAVELLEERLELGCWAYCDACILRCSSVT